VIAVTKPATVIRPPKVFDLAKFESMVEPFTVRVEKIKGSTKYEIPMPPDAGGGAPGTGWSKDQTRELQTWLVNEWSGGGHYGIAITDSSVPPQMMEWNAYYPPHEFPEKVPPTLQGAFLPNVPVPGSVAAAHPVNQGRSPMAQFSGSGSSLPPASMFPQQTMPAPAPQPGYYPPPPYYATPIAPAVAAAQPNNEVAMLREALAQQREQNVQREFERRLAEIKADSDRRVAEMQTTMQAMVEKLTASMQAAARPAVDPQIEHLREQTRMLQEQDRRRVEEMDRMRREQEMRDQIKASQEQMARLVDESNRRFEAFMASNANKGPDPQIMMFQQMFAAQMDAMKEISRTSQSQLDRVQNFMMRPQDVLAIAKESATSADQVAVNMSRQWEQMFNVSRQLTEQAAQLNSGGGGNEVIGLIREGAGKLGEWAEKYTGSKAKENIAQVNAQAEIAKAQADVTKAQLERMSEMARMEAALKSGAVVQMPDGSYRAGGAAPQPAISAPPMGVPGRPWVAPKAAAAAAGGLNGAPASNVVPINDGQRRVKGRTDLEWFGIILPNVKQLRDEVAAFIKALEQTPPQKAGLSPEEATMAIQMAAAEVMNRQIPIPAMVDLLLQGMVPDFLDVLLPDAPQSYRDDVVKLLMTDPSADDADDDDEDDEDEGEAPAASA
jgi:hypothetical protein